LHSWYSTHLATRVLSYITRYARAETLLRLMFAIWKKDGPCHGKQSSHNTCASVLSAGELHFGFTMHIIACPYYVSVISYAINTLLYEVYVSLLLCHTVR